MKKLRAGTRRDGDEYVGVLREGRRIVIECGHRHRNRDLTYPSSGISARDCIGRVVAGAGRMIAERDYADKYRGAWQNLTRGTGFTCPPSVIEDAKVSSAADADAYLEKVAKVREIEGIEPKPIPVLPRLPLL